jgi:hypothetical protein
MSLTKVIEGIIIINDSDATPEAKINAAIVNHLETLINDFEGAFMLQHEFHIPQEYQKKVLSFRHYYEKSFIQIIEEGIESGVFRIKNAKLGAFIILGAINWLLRWYSSSGSWSAQEIAEVYVDLLCNGLLTKRKNFRIPLST